MEGDQPDIQALLHNIDCDFGDYKLNRSPQSPLPLARLISSSYKLEDGPSIVPRSSLTLIDEQQPLYVAQTFECAGTQPYSTHNDRDFDQFGSCP